MSQGTLVRHVARLCLGGCLWLAVAAGAADDVILVTLDTTRADYLGSYGRAGATTPNLDALAARGLRFARALTVAPLTLPAHASLMTGRIPPAHGIHDNGLHRLPDGLPTIAESFRVRGYATGAVVASAVLDHRFGLDRGFDHYDDALTAEFVGEYGYPERDAAEVTDAALAWLRTLPPGEPYFLWVHYYDPHSPYLERGRAGTAPEVRYGAEIAFVDEQLGRLLDVLPGHADQRVVAVVADHGEMLGEHGERAHGLLLYRASLEVPLLITAPGLEPGRVVTETVASLGLGASLVSLTGGDPSPFGEPLPGVAGRGCDPCPPIYSEAWLPATAYGWSRMLAVTEGRWRYVEAPQPELYDFVADPDESINLVATRSDEATRLRAALGAFAEANLGAEPAPKADAADLAEQLRSLGYLSGMSGDESGEIDPKEGLALLDEFESAKATLAAGDAWTARRQLESLVRRNPSNVPFLMRAADAQFATQEPARGLELLERALEVNPQLDLTHLRQADVLAELGRSTEAGAAYRRALKLNPRLSGAWLGLARLSAMAGDGAAERSWLESAVEAGTLSAGIFARLGQLSLAAGDLVGADDYLSRSTELLSTLAPSWWSWGLVAERTGKTDLAIERFERALELNPGDPGARVYVGRLLLAAGRQSEARAMLTLAVRVAPGSAPALEAERLLASLAPDPGS